MKKIFSIILFLSLMFSFNVVFAQLGDNAGDAPTTVNASNDGKTTVTANPNQSKNQTSSKLQNPLNATSVKDVILLAVNITVYIGISFAILAIIFVGFKFVLAQGNPEKIKEARTWFYYIIIGLAILISARVIVEIVQNTLVKSGVVNQNAWSPPN